MSDKSIDPKSAPSKPDSAETSANQPKDHNILAQFANTADVDLESPPTSLKQRLQWQCRRGMLELDIILKPFLDAHFDQLSPSQQQVFCELLEQADPDLFCWLMGYAQCQDTELNLMIQLIRQKTSNLR